MKRMKLAAALALVVVLGFILYLVVNVFIRFYFGGLTIMEDLGNETVNVTEELGYERSFEGESNAAYNPYALEPRGSASRPEATFNEEDGFSEESGGEMQFVPFEDALEDS